MKSCERCAYQGENWKFHVHHRDRDRSNNVASNLETLCIPCHRKEHGEDRMKAETSKILLRLPVALRERLDEYRGDVSLTKAISRILDAALPKGEVVRKPMLPPPPPGQEYVIADDITYPDRGFASEPFEESA